MYIFFLMVSIYLKMYVLFIIYIKKLEKKMPFACLNYIYRGFLYLKLQNKTFLFFLNDSFSLKSQLQYFIIFMEISIKINNTYSPRGFTIIMMRIPSKNVCVNEII